MEPELCQPAAAPDPVGLNGIDQQADHAGIHAVGGKLRPLRHRPGDDGRRGRAENEVEHESAGICKPFAVCGDKLPEVKEHIEVRLADQAPQGILSHHERITQKGKHHGSDAEIHQVLHNDVAGVFRPGKPGLHHGKSRLHPEHQRRTDQKPEFNSHSFRLLSCRYGKRQGHLLWEHKRRPCLFMSSGPVCALPEKKKASLS